jgi:hypothetical protein
MSQTHTQTIHHVSSPQTSCALRRSLWLALLWKEWRQQRFTALFLGAFCLLGYFAYCRVVGGRPEPTGWVVLLGLASACLGASVFAAESDDRTASFLSSLPLSRWIVVAVKYATSLTLVVPCLLLPALLLRPRLDEAFGGTILAEAWQTLTPLWGTILCMSAIIAVAGALAGSGLGAMPTLFASVGLTAASAVLFELMGLKLAKFSFDQELGIKAGLFAAWFLPHLWLVRTWCRRPASARRWRPMVWAVAVVLGPAIFQAGAMIGERPLMDSADAIASGNVVAVPSPDGQTVALSLSPSRPGPRFGFGKTRAWLLNVDTGTRRRLGPWWRDCWFPSWNGDATCWSPDGRWVRLQSTGMFAPTELSDDEHWDQVRESVWRVARPARVWAHAGYVCTRWLGDGTMTAYAPDAWEFRDLDSGTVRRCLTPPRDTSIDGQWYNVQKVWLDREIASVQVSEPGADGRRVCRYWRAAPDLDRTERHDFPLPIGMPEGYLRAIPSKDAQWTLLADPGGREHRLWLVSLVTGTCRQLDLPARLEHDPFFLPDGSSVVAPCSAAFHLWNMAAEQWDAPIALPAVELPEHTRYYRTRSKIAVSPVRPWRVAFAPSLSGNVYSVDLAGATVTKALSLAPIENQPFWDVQVSWFGRDRLLVERQGPYQLWVVHADGTEPRQVLP